MSSLARIPFSVLDLAPIVQGRDAADAFRNTVALAQHVERLGYKRFWLAEHHNINGVASSATAVLIGHVASQTSTLRVGSGGVMLPNHAPLIIAEQFGTLETLYPGRIDLGLGRAPGSDGATQHALRRGPRSGLEFPALVEELRGFLAPSRPDSRFAPFRAKAWTSRSGCSDPAISAPGWRPNSACRSRSPGTSRPRAWRRCACTATCSSRPATLARPYAMIGVPVVAAETDEEARHQATTQQLKFLSLVRGHRPATAAAVDNMDGVWNEWERGAVNQRLGAAHRRPGYRPARTGGAW